MTMMIHADPAVKMHDSLASLRMYDIRTPKPTRTWTPISHSEFVEEIFNQVRAAGFGIAKTSYVTTRNGARLFGTMKLDMELTEGVALVLGYRNAWDKAFAAGIAAGHNVFVCDNLCFSGDIAVFRKHTTNIRRDLPGKIGEAVNKVTGYATAERNRIIEMMDTTAHDPEAILVQAARDKAINWGHLQKIVTLWDADTEDDKYGDEPTMWKLFNCCTEAQRAGFDKTPHQAQARTQKLSMLFQSWMN